MNRKGPRVHARQREQVVRDVTRAIGEFGDSNQRLLGVATSAGSAFCRRADRSEGRSHLVSGVGEEAFLARDGVTGRPDSPPRNPPCSGRRDRDRQRSDDDEPDPESCVGVVDGSTIHGDKSCTADHNAVS